MKLDATFGKISATTLIELEVALYTYNENLLLSAHQLKFALLYDGIRLYA